MVTRLVGCWWLVAHSHWLRINRVFVGLFIGLFVVVCDRRVIIFVLGKPMTEKGGVASMTAAYE